MKKYVVKYQAGPYSGTRVIYAEDSEAAKNKVRGEIRRGMSLPMYSDSYKIVSESENEDDE